MLYANEELSDFLRENFVLAWTSERPVPKVAIDFGDGRVLHRTLTGNAAHYVLDAQGRPIDAIPGLYGPQPFRQALGRVLKLHNELQGLEGDEWLKTLQLHHFKQMGARTGSGISLGGPNARFSAGLRGRNVQAGSLTSEEIAMVARRTANARPRAGLYEGNPLFERKIEGDEWIGYAMFKRDLVRLDRRSVVLMARALPEDQRRELTAEGITDIVETARPFPDAKDATRVTVGKSELAEEPILARLSEPDGTLKGMVTRFLETLTADSIRNEREFHRQIHGWFAMGEVEDFATLNDRVYSEIFLTPKDDPWLGLVPGDSYTALNNDGRE